MNLNSMFVGIFVFLGLFAILLVTMPTEFKQLGIDADVMDKEACSYFDEHNVTMYNNTATINLQYGVSNKSDFGGEIYEFWWDYETHFTRDMLEVRHLTDELWGWWYGWHYLVMPESDWSRTTLGTGIGIDRDGLLELFDEDYNATVATFACEHINFNLYIVTANQSWTLEESWDNKKLKIFTSYEIDWTKTGTNMWRVMFQLLTYQNPDLGIPGIGGMILSHAVSLTLTASILLLSFALITSVIPFIRGWGGGG